MSRITRGTGDRLTKTPTPSPRPAIASRHRAIASPLTPYLTTPSPRPLRRPPNASHYESEHFTLRLQERASESPTHLAVGDDRTPSHPLTQHLTVVESDTPPKKDREKYAKHLP